MGSPFAPRTQLRPARLCGASARSRREASYDRAVAAGECVQIMTGAPVPSGADAVVMIEFTKADAAGESRDV